MAIVVLRSGEAVNTLYLLKDVLDSVPAEKELAIKVHVDGGEAVTWTRKEAMHITLKFLGLLNHSSIGRDFTVFSIGFPSYNFPIFQLSFQLI